MKKVIVYILCLGMLLIFFWMLGRNYSCYIVCSGSMEKEISTGSIVVVDRSKITPKVGNVVTYHMGNQLVTHRICGIKDGKYITKGDANQEPDAQLVTKEQMKGTVILHIPYVGYCINYIKKHYILICLGMCVLLIVSEKITLNLKKHKIQKA